ncbi:[Fe-S]-binding protein [Candidatus Leptofilum sp.]|uniref:[Fe-S]-binding protein n=1 Tax=Candidatus Leptofilum sp. TaxID=3241576 RepID=UPI003B5C8361
MKLKSRLQHKIQPYLMKPLLKKMLAWEASVRERPGSLHGGENSPSRFNILAAGLSLRDDHPPMPGFPKSVPHVFGSVTNIRKSVHDLDRNPVNGKKIIDDKILVDLCDYAKSVGVDEVGFATVPQEWVFRETAVLYNKAIVLVMEMDKARMQLAPNKDTAVMVHETYDLLGRASNKIADWLRERGYAAHAGHPLNGMALYPPMAQVAGLGYRGIHGLLITPQFGPRVRLAAVFTEIENLPMYGGHEHEWLLDFCQICHRCIRDCPPQAIYETPIEHENGLVTTVDNAKCFPYFANNHGCSVCIKVCPFNHTNYERLHETYRRKMAKTEEAIEIL